MTGNNTIVKFTYDGVVLENEEWKNTKMIFEIAQKGDKTILHFTHEGLIPEKECYSLCHEGWNTVIKDYLFNYISKGEAHF